MDLPITPPDLQWLVGLSLGAATQALDLAHTRHRIASWWGEPCLDVPPVRNDRRVNLHVDRGEVVLGRVVAATHG